MRFGSNMSSRISPENLSGGRRVEAGHFTVAAFYVAQSSAVYGRKACMWR